MESNYNKYKDNDPKDTILRIQKILNNAGLFPVLDWMDTNTEGALCNRVTLYPSALGTNGKGTDRLYASASGYAELMERMENYMLCPPSYHPAVLNYGDFMEFPDEENMEIDELAERDDAFLNYFFEKLGCSDPLAKQLILTNYANIISRKADGKITVVPYADMTEGKIAYLPNPVVRFACASNGMAAGNTIEEAIVQGMCEVYERHVNRAILTGKAVPPEIPEEELRKYSIWDLKKEIEGDGRYHISVRDGSLGKGYPVAVSIITDRQNGSFGVKLGSHPSLAVAVERTLTEALQGRTADTFSTTNSFGSKEQAESYHNIPNIMKINIGVYPATLLSGKPGWEYRPWTEWEGKSNKEFVTHILNLAERDGWHMYIRDNSHLGFPAVQIVVPGYSEMYELGGTHNRSLMTSEKAHDAFCHFPDLTGPEEETILKIIRFKENSFIENTPAVIIGRPVTDSRMSPDRIAAFIAFKRGEYAIAAHFFNKLATYYPDDGEVKFYKGIKKWCDARMLGLDDEECFRLLSELFGAGPASRVRDEAGDPDGILKRNFPAMRCFDCEHCELNGKGCDNLIEEEIQKKIKDAMKDSKVSQQELLERLNSL